MKTSQHIRDLAIQLLTDEHGIGQDAWTTLFELLQESGSQDIIDAVTVIESRVCLPESAMDTLTP